MPLAVRCSPSLHAVVAVATLLAVAPATAGVIHVPGDRPTIQQAINATIAGDTVRVAPGTYVETINFIGKAIVVTSEAGPATTIIDANHAGSAVRIVSGEGSASVLSGFQLRNGSGDFSGAGGITIIGSSPTILGNVIRDCSGSAGGIQLSNSQSRVEGNTIDRNQGSGVIIGGGSPIVVDNTISNNSAGSGGGVDCEFSSASILRNRIRGNSGQFGGGLYVGGDASAQIEGNLIENNVAGNGAGMTLFAAGTPTIRNNVFRNNGQAGQGGGMWIVNFSDAFIVQNVFVGNRALSGGGIYWAVPSGARGPRLLNNTFALNSASQGSALFADGFDGNAEIVGNVIVAPAGETALFCGDFDQSIPRIRYNDVFTPSGFAYGGICPDLTGLNGNIKVDPAFRNAARNFRLSAGSACLDAGDSTATDLPATDLDGQPRAFDANGDGSARVDIGAYEFGDANLPPIANAGGPYAGDVDAPFAFDGSGSLDPDEDALTFAWDFGDGSAGIGATVSHQYAHLGSYRVVLTVSDATHSDSDTTTADVLDINSPPVAVAGGPYSGLAGQPLQFNGLGSHDPEGDSLSYHWTFGDGASADGPTPTHAYPYATVFQVVLEVRDAQGVDRDTTTATITFATADVFSLQSHAPDPAVAGRPLNYSIAVGNRGPDAANDASMSFAAFGVRRSITSVTTTRGTCAADTGGCCVTCTFGALAPGDSARVQIALTPAEEGFLSVSINAGSPTPDPDFSNNGSFGGVQVLFSAEQRLTSLIALVQSYRLRRGTEKTLVDRLDAARTAVAAGDTSGGCGDISSFRQRVGKLAGRGLTLTQALDLDREADTIQQRLGCSKLALSPAAMASLPTEFAFRLQASLGAAAQAELDLPVPAAVRVEVFDINGRLVRIPVDATFPPGTHDVAWDGRGSDGSRAPVGVYFMRVAAGKDAAVSRFTLLR